MKTFTKIIDNIVKRWNNIFRKLQIENKKVKNVPCGTLGGEKLKLVKQKYFTASGESKVNCYKITLSKKYIEKAGIKETDDLEVYVEGNKIIIRKKG